ncbi:class I SAM-dependent methyltransferase [Aquihabitans sp. G128]|uniref:RsmG family class I SAM-dependent methyltransferase n=1 Tax=Aquihabitans sp. G128 TaxID=2849779 RepID=UPI001C21DE5E|nr:RsmG family class I SAM-dependent methyltransferase [Aquihabitans sp. G128]QXC59828.1 class I SAM-dependent methyltransferase [Aquihabitans sp. G128]
MTASLTELLTESRQLGFLGPGPVEDHIWRAAAYLAAAPAPPARALDLGAGGGLPGLVLAATAWPETHWCFLDGMSRRTSFLERAVAKLGLADRVDVVTERAELTGHDPAHRGAYDLVVARSFAAPAVAAECAAPLLRPGGHLVVSEPPETPLAERWPAEGLAELGFGTPEAVAVPGPSGEEPTHLVRLELVAAPADRYPRRVGIPAKRPLF